MGTKYERIYSDIKDEIGYLEEKYYKENYSSAFGHYMIKNKFKLNDEEVYNLITDGYEDNGIDAVYIEKGKIAHFFQFKFPENEKGIGKGVTENEILKLFNGFEAFTSSEDQFNKIKWNEMLNEKRCEFIENDIYEFKLWIIRYTNKAVSQNAICKLEQNIARYKTSTGNELQEEYILAEKCSTIYESSVKKAWPNFTLKYKSMGSVFSDENTETKSAYISLKSLYDSLLPIKNEIFEGNVRYYNADSKINDGIKRSLLNNKENFHLLNNGITIISDGCYYNTAKECLDIVEGSIINGAQTVGTIFETLESLSQEEINEYENGFVFVKIISFKEENQVINEMIYTLNTQNTMKSSYIVANDAIINSVKNKINVNTEYYLEVKTNEFNFEKNKNQNLNKLHKNVICIETLIQVYVAFYNLEKMAYLSKNAKGSLFESDNIDKIVNQLRYEDSIIAYEIYLKVMNIITKYRAYKKNDEKIEIIELLEIKEEEIEEYKFLNTGNFVILYALGIVYGKKGEVTEANMKEIIILLASIFKKESNISNATKKKESFEKIEKEVKKYIKMSEKIDLKI